MTDRRRRADAYLRERGTAARPGGVVTTARWWGVVTTLVVGLAACSTGTHNDTYARGTQIQEQCCEHLAGAARDSCLRDVVRIDDSAATQTATNQLTYACVVEHFVCDPRTGHETRESAQAQHDCTDNLD
jgi:hypothetical protein